MISRPALRTLMPAGRLLLRALTTSAPLRQEKDKFSTPSQYWDRSQAEIADQKQFVSTMLKEQFGYEPQTITEDVVDPVSKKPVPLNVELLRYKPMRWPRTHSHQVVEMKFRSHDKLDIMRASEFAARAAYYLGIPCDRVQNVKAEKRLYTVIRSPFAQAKSKENFHRITHRRTLKAYDAEPEIVDLWLSYVNKHKIANVEYAAQITTREPVDFAEKLANLTAEDMKWPEAYAAGSSDPVAAKVDELLKSDTFKKYLEETK